MRKLLVSGLLLAVTLPGPAVAGGALWDLNQDFYLPGEVVRAESGVWLESGMGRLEDGPFHAYLSEFDMDRMPPPLPPDAIRVAPVVVEPRPGTDYGDASVEFELPSLPPGKYFLSTCNDPCEVQLGDLMPTLLLVAESEEGGEVAVMKDRLSWRIRSLRTELMNRVFGHRADSLRNRITALERDVARVEAEVDALREAAAQRVERPPEDDPAASLPALLAFVVPAALLGVLFGHRYRSAA
ncbi:MAG TPA: hypothetical protein VHJ76_05415 [Actinomycetota bacterium]|nr:hypothetical protein [Actinomycetota bacterium]